MLEIKMEVQGSTLCIQRLNKQGGMEAFYMDKRNNPEEANKLLKALVGVFDLHESTPGVFRARIS